MSDYAPKSTFALSSLRACAIAAAGATSPYAKDGQARCRTILQTLRSLLAKQNLPESVDPEDEGFYFVVEDRSQISLQYNSVSLKPCSASLAASRRQRTGFFKYCNELARRGYAFSMFISPRTLVLYIDVD